MKWLVLWNMHGVVHTQTLKLVRGDAHNFIMKTLNDGILKTSREIGTWDDFPKGAACLHSLEYMSNLKWNEVKHL